ncbi:ABC transporter ATP-binding protein [Yinghuangia seranimata]|uniref:ABC transporter ATP-binding protein n=1 Tax=Yinghuangia seranimata TaxID=408067 RepID=UPI00248C790D|nr:ABC transporter ATP-binding protein [Yinghuangia seranimata]MDI2124546.1 ABC transporter ATP-binding protein [Yinghuangia seranimata]
MTADTFTGPAAGPTELGSDVIRLEAVSKRYGEAGPAALDAVDLTVRPGEAVAVMGPSGSGKSTLLNVVAGLDRPTSGAVTVAGTPLAGLSETRLARFRRERVGMVFQFFHLLDDLTAVDNVLMPARLGGMSARAARARADELLGYLGIADRADAYPSRLSGGERQRVAIARALMNRPPLLLADEPTGAVDSATGQHIMELLAELNRDGQALLLVTHDPALARHCAHRVVHMVDGRLTDDHRPTEREVFASEADAAPRHGSRTEIPR